MALARFTRQADRNDYDQDDREWAVNPAFVVSVEPVKGDPALAVITVNWGMGCNKVTVLMPYGNTVERLRHAERQIVEVAQ